MKCIAKTQTSGFTEKCTKKAQPRYLFLWCSQHVPLGSNFWKFLWWLLGSIVVGVIVFFITMHISIKINKPKPITNIHGYVTIKDTDRIIDSAKVFVVGKEKISCFTEKTGRYNLDIPKKYQDTIYSIIVEKENYISEEKTIIKAELINGRDIDIELRPQK